jgi:hypothetical protein
MLTWDETKEAVQQAQSTTKEDFERHVANYVVQDALGKLIDDYVKITFDRYKDAGEDVDEMDMEWLMERVSYECAIFMTGIQVGWYMSERAFRA